MTPRALSALLLTLALAGGCAEFDYGRAGGGPPAGYAGQAPTVYTVRRGDTLYSIAWRYGLDYRRVAQWNRIASPYVIHPGQTLRLREPPSRGDRVARADDRRPAGTKSSTAAEAPAIREPAGAAPDWQWPVKGEVLKHYDADGIGKRGISLAGELGSPVRAAAAGRVVYSGNGLRGYGNLVIVKHSSRYLTAYGYNRELLVREGDSVERGQVIARMGRSPEGTVALHFEIRHEGKPIDPLGSLPRR